MEALMTSEGLISLVTLTFMEIILGIDNIVFISIIVGKLPEDQQPRARNLGLLLALLFRVALLTGIKWLVGLTQPLFTITLWGMIEPFGVNFKDLVLFAGGLFLIAKSISEMHHKLEGVEDEDIKLKSKNFFNIILQIILIDIVFSFDSILTAVGLADQLIIMILAVVISMVIMIAFAGVISDFINKRPTMKMLALSFLILIGFMLVLEGFHQHINKGYIYFAMAFSLVVELLNTQLRKKTDDPVKLRDRIPDKYENE